MTSVGEEDRISLKARSHEDVLWDVIFDNSEKSDCVEGHCPLKQVLSLRSLSFSDLSCYGGKVNDGCSVKLAVVGLGATPYEIVRSKFLAQLKHKVGEQIGFDIHSDGALRVFEGLGLERRFKRGFDRYMAGEIEVRDIYFEVITGVNLIEATRNILRGSIRRNGEGKEYYERRAVMSMEYFG